MDAVLAFLRRSGLRHRLVDEGRRVLFWHDGRRCSCHQTYADVVTFTTATTWRVPRDQRAAVLELLNRRNAGNPRGAWFLAENARFAVHQTRATSHIALWPERGVDPGQDLSPHAIVSCLDTIRHEQCWYDATCY